MYVFSQQQIRGPLFRSVHFCGHNSAPLMKIPQVNTRRWIARKRMNELWMQNYGQSPLQLQNCPQKMEALIEKKKKKSHLTFLPTIQHQNKQRNRWCLLVTSPNCRQHGHCRPRGRSRGRLCLRRPSISPSPLKPRVTMCTALSSSQIVQLDSFPSSCG